MLERENTELTLQQQQTYQNTELASLRLLDEVRTVDNPQQRGSSVNRAASGNGDQSAPVRDSFSSFVLPFLNLSNGNNPAPDRRGGDPEHANLQVIEALAVTLLVGLHAPGDNTAQDPKLREMRESGDDNQRLLAERLESWLGSDDAASRHVGQRILEMLKNDDHKQLALEMLQRLSPESCRQVLQTLDDAGFENAAARISQMLSDTNNLNSPAGANLLLDLLGSSDEQERYNGRRVLDMLVSDDRRQQETGRQLLETFSIDHQGLGAILALMDGNPEAADVILNLLSSGNAQESAAGTRLLDILSSHDRAVRQDGERLLNMIKNGAQKADACAILSRLEDPEQIRLMLAIMDKPAFRAASDRLLAMLRSDERAPVATNLLRMLGSESADEKSDGQALLFMLNGNVERDRRNAENLLRLVPDRRELHSLLGPLRDEATRRGAEHLLDLLGRPAGSQESRIGNGLLERLASSQRDERTTAVDLLKLLSGNARDEQAARTILSRLGDNNLQRQLLNLYTSGDRQQRAAAEQLLTWLDGDRTLPPDQQERQRSAAQSLLRLLNNQGKDGRPSPDSTFIRDTLLRMVADPAQRDNACIILNRLSEPVEQSEMLTMLRLLQDPRQRTGAQEVLRMLGSNSDEDVRAAHALLRIGIEGRSVGPDGQATRRKPTGAGDPYAEADRQQLLQMLASPEQRAAARDILLRFDNALARHAILNLWRDDRASATAVLNDRRLGPLAQDIMAVPTTARGYQEIINTLTRPENSDALAQLQRLSREGVSSTELMRMLGSANRSTRAAGEQLLGMLNRPGTDSSGDPNRPLEAESILRAGLIADEMHGLLSLLNDRQDEQRREAGRLLLDLAQSSDLNSVGVRHLLRAVSSPDEATRCAANQLLEQIADPAQRDTVTELLSAVRSHAELQRLAAALACPQLRPGAGELADLLRSPDDDTRRGAQIVAGMLTGDSPDDRERAEHILRMLGDANQRETWRTVLSNLNDPQLLREFLRITSPGLTSSTTMDEEMQIGNQLMEMMRSGRADDIRGVRNVLSLLTSQNPVDHAHGAELAMMLGTSEQRATARAVLNNLSSPQQCSWLMSALSNPDQARSARVLLDILRSDNEEHHKSVQELLKILATNDQNGPADRGEAQATTVAARALFQLLGSAVDDERRLAREALLAARDEKELQRLAGMLTGSVQSRDALQRLMQMRRDPNQLRAAETLIATLETPEQIQQFMTLRENNRALSDVLLSMLRDGAGGGNTAARQFLSIAAGASDSARRATARLAEMLVDPNRQAEAAEMLRSVPSQYLSRFLDIATNQRTQHARNELIRLLNSEGLTDRPVALELLALLTSANADARARGEELLEQLNSPDQTHTAINELRRRRNPNSERMIQLR